MHGLHWTPRPVWPYLRGVDHDRSCRRYWFNFERDWSYGRDWCRFEYTRPYGGYWCSFERDWSYGRYWRSFDYTRSYGRDWRRFERDRSYRPNGWDRRCIHRHGAFWKSW